MPHPSTAKLRRKRRFTAATFLLCWCMSSRGVAFGFQQHRQQFERGRCRNVRGEDGQQKARGEDFVPSRTKPTNRRRRWGEERTTTSSTTATTTSLMASRTWVQKRPGRFRQPNNSADSPSTSYVAEANGSSTSESTSKLPFIDQDLNGRPQSSFSSRRSAPTPYYTLSSTSASATANTRSSARRNREKMTPMPLKGYDATAIEERYDRRPLEVGWRLNSLGIPLLGWYLRLLMDKATGMDGNVDVQRLRGEELRLHLIQSKSVALIKSGQALSLRPDLIRNRYWAEELGKLVDAVGSFSDAEAMKIMRKELSDLIPRMDASKDTWKQHFKRRLKDRKASKGLEKLVETDGILSLFEFYNDYRCCASASIGQVYKARIRQGPQLVAAIGHEEAARWGGRVVAVKVQRPDVEASASLDMYLLRRTAMWLNKVGQGGNLAEIADAFGMQLFGELDYVREANNCARFQELYGDWNDIKIPEACDVLTRRRVLVMDWVDGEKPPWSDPDEGLRMVRIGLRCSVDQLMTTGLFHADPHRGNLLKTDDDKLALIDFGMVVDVDEDFRYSLFGLVIGLQNKDLPLVTENLLKLGFLRDTTQLDELVPRLRQALKNATGGTGKASDVNFARLQAEIDDISRHSRVEFSTPPFFTIIIRSLTILEGVALSVDENFRLVRGAYPYVLRQLLSPDDDKARPPPAALQDLLLRLLTVNGKGQEIEWERLRDLLRLAQRATESYDLASSTRGSSSSSSLSSSITPSTNGSGAVGNPTLATQAPTTTAKLEDRSNADSDKTNSGISRKTVELFAKFLTSRTGVFLKKPLVHELAEAVDGMASIGEANLLKLSRGLIPILPGMNGPVNTKRMDEIRKVVDTFRDAIIAGSGAATSDSRIRFLLDFVRGTSDFLRDAITSGDDDDGVNNAYYDISGPLVQELQSVIQMVAVEVLEIRGSRAMRTILGVTR